MSYLEGEAKCCKMKKHCISLGEQGGGQIRDMSNLTGLFLHIKKSTRDVGKQVHGPPQREHDQDLGKPVRAKLVRLQVAMLIDSHLGSRDKNLCI